MPNPATVPLLTAAPFAILAGSGITIAGAVNSSSATGNIGTFPTTSETGLGNLVLNGVNHAGDGTTQQAKLDLTAAYLDAAGRLGASTIATALGSTTLTPGVYTSAAGTFSITGTLTLDGGGNPNAVFIFQMATTLTTAASSNVVLIGGAQAANVFWQVGSSATLGTSANLLGTILALTSITATTSGTVTGRLLARNGAVTLDTNTIAIPILTPAINPANAPSTVLAQGTCFNCLSPNQLDAILLVLWARAAGLTLPQDLATVLAQSKVFNCLSDQDMKIVEITKRWKTFSSGSSCAALVKAADSVRCLDPKYVKAATLLMQITYLDTLTPIA